MIDSLLVFVSTHPHLTYIFIFLVSLSESLALVGLLIPGTVVMLGIGALVGVGSIKMEPTLVCAAFGAVAGDAISYWLGLFYQERLRGIWPFSKYSHLLLEGESFFRKHGGKSVFIGRFIGPIRPVIPLVAGMMNMPCYYFTFVNITSAAAWAFAYIVPGVILGTSLTIAGIVSTRLIILTVLVFVLFWSLFWLSKKVFGIVMFTSNRWLIKFFEWAKSASPEENKTRLLKKIASFFLPGSDKDEHIFPLMLFTSTFSGGLFVILSQSGALGVPVARLDQNLFNFLRSMRNPLADRFFAVITGLGNAKLVFLLLLSLLILLICQRALKAAFFVLASIVGGFGLVNVFKWIFHVNNPSTSSHGTIPGWAFPSASATYVAIFFGVLCILLARSIERSRIGARTKRIYSWILLSLAITVSFFIGFSRLYLGINWLSGVLGGLFLGWAWIAFCGLIYLKVPYEKINTRTLLVASFLIFITFGSGIINANMDRNLRASSTQIPLKTVTTDRWLRVMWERLPVVRTDIRGKVRQPLPLQYIGDLDELKKYFTEHNWNKARYPEMRSLLTTLSPHVHLYDLPILPRLLNGKFENLILYKNTTDARLVFRIWSTRFETKKLHKRLYVGTIESQVSKKITPWITVATDSGDYVTPLGEIYQDLPKKEFLFFKKNYFEKRRKIMNMSKKIKWDGTVLLIISRTATSLTRANFP